MRVVKEIVLKKNSLTFWAVCAICIGLQATNKRIPILDNDFTRLNNQLLSNVSNFLANHLPGGKFKGFEYFVKNPTRDDKQEGSFSVNATTGQWYDFATGEKGSDLVSLYAYLSGKTQKEALTDLCTDFTPEIRTKVGQNFDKSNEKPDKTKKDLYKSITPVPIRAGKPPFASSPLGEPSAYWTYHNARGDVLFYVLRFDVQGQRKQFKPLSYGLNLETGEEEWLFKSIQGTKPLYNLDKITKASTVIVCEGEKAADAAAKLFPQYATTTSPNGSDSVRHCDWSPLANKRVFIWPDNDSAGIKFAENVKAFVKHANIISIPGGKDEKWDAADAVLEGWTTEQAEDLIREFEPQIADLFDLDEARITTFLESAPPRRVWLFDGLLPANIVGLIVAPGGTGKSQFAVQVGLSISSGVPLCNKWTVGEQGGVLMLFAEDDQDELHRRIYNAYRQSGADFGLVSKRMFAKSMVAKNNMLTELKDKELTRTGYVDSLIATARKIPDLKLVVIDPISRFRGGEPNSEQDSTKFVETLEYVAKTLGCGVIMLHHVNKQSMQVGSLSQAAARGSSALTDGVRWQANMAGMSEAEASQLGISAEERYYFIRFGVPKFNYGSPVGEHWLTRKQGGYLVVEDLKGQNRLDALQQSVIRAIAADGRNYTKADFVSEFGGRNNRFKVSESALSRAVDTLIRNGNICLTNEDGCDILRTMED